MKFIFFILAILACSCTTTEPSRVSASMQEFKDHEVLGRWIAYRKKLRMATPKEMAAEQSSVEESLAKSQSTEDAMKLGFILLSINNPEHNVQKGRELLNHLLKSPGINDDLKVALILLEDFSQDLVTILERQKLLRSRLEQALEAKDSLEKKIEALTNLEQSLSKRAEDVTDAKKPLLNDKKTTF